MEIFYAKTFVNFLKVLFEVTDSFLNETFCMCRKMVFSILLRVIKKRTELKFPSFYSRGTSLPWQNILNLPKLFYVLTFIKHSCLEHKKLIKASKLFIDLENVECFRNTFHFFSYLQILIFATNSVTFLITWHRF